MRRINFISRILLTEIAFFNFVIVQTAGSEGRAKGAPAAHTGWRVGPEAGGYCKEK